MGMWQLIAELRSAKQVAALAARIARESQLEVWQRVQHRALRMSPPEARGYVRARCMDLIQGRVREALHDETELTERFHSRVLAESVEGAVNLVSLRLATERAGAAALSRAA